MSDVNCILTSLLLSYAIRKYFWRIVVIEVSYILERIFVFLEAQLIAHLIFCFLISNVFADFGFVSTYGIYVISFCPEHPSSVSTLRLFSSTSIACGFFYEKKSVESHDSTLFYWCTSRTHIRTFLCFHGFPESDRFRTFLIIKGNESLIIVEIDGIDEGVH